MVLIKYFFALLAVFFVIVPIANAQYAPITFRYNHFLFELDPDEYPEWRSTFSVWEMNGKEILPDPEYRVDGDTLPVLPDNLLEIQKTGWNTGAIRSTLFAEIAKIIDREPRSVVINMDKDGIPLFEGVGITGRTTDLDKATALVLEALRSGIHDILLPVHEIQPKIGVHSEELRNIGISEVLVIGESDFRGSPEARKHNIAVGLERFNGAIIQSGAVFSFNEILGPVNAASGYKKELIISGDKTIPDYGGGLCQVSTTAYRGMWEYGFPILERTNHSYSVRYYFPQGTDATIYPPYKDVKFLNDSQFAVLLQTHVEDGFAYFIYYGTRDNRSSDIIGPFLWARTSVPEDRVEYTTEIPPGTQRRVGERVPGIKAAWFRFLKKDGEEPLTVQPTYSHYEARPRYTQIGVEQLEIESIDSKIESEVPNNF